MDFLKFLKLEPIIDNIKGYIETRIQLIKLEAQERIAQVLTIILLIACVAFFGVLAFLFLNLALAAYLNTLLDSQYLGFLILGVFYLFLMLLVAINISKGGIHKLIKRKTASLFIKSPGKNGSSKIPEKTK